MPFTFTADTIEEIGRQLLRVKRMQANTAAEVRRVSRGRKDYSVKYIAKTGGSGIGARSSDTPGSATVTIYQINADGDLETLKDSTGSDWTVTAYNLSTSAVAADTYIHIIREMGSKQWLVDYEDCG